MKQAELDGKRYLVNSCGVVGEIFADTRLNADGFENGRLCNGEEAEAVKRELQTLIPDTPQRKVPETGLKPKRVQTNKPTLLEVYEEEVKQPKLF
jgi:hypothetical protein